MNAKTIPSVRCATCLAAALLCSGLAVRAELLNNPGFESAVLNQDTDWSQYSNDPSGYIACKSASYGPPAHGGSRKLDMSMLGGSAGGLCQVSQTLSATAGDQVTFSGYANNWSMGGLGQDYYATLQITFSDSGGTSISTAQSLPHLGWEQHQDSWWQLNVSASAPEGTATATFYAMMVRQIDSPNISTIWFDDMTVAVSPVPEPTIVWALAVGVIVAAAWRHHRRAGGLSAHQG